MSKQAALIYILLNGFFLVLNMFFMMVGAFPAVNFIAGLISLGGLASSYALYINSEE